MTITQAAATSTPRPPGGHGYRDLARLMTLMTGDEKHQPSAHSTLDVLWVLYDRVLRVSPDRVDDPDRDRFLLSKGHGPVAYYAILAAKGFIDESWLEGFSEFDSRLGHHPDRMLIDGVEISSGSLGHGLPLAVGVAHGLLARARAADTSGPDGSGASGGPAPRVVVLVGDAELDEGSNHEAIAYAGAAGLPNLTVVVIDNHSTSHPWHGGIAAHFEVAGWSAITVDGRDHDALERAFTRPTDRADVVVANVEVKGS